MAPVLQTDPPPVELLRGVEQFNRGEYFECHKTLEDLWKTEPRPVRELYQGILQIGVALHHLRAERYRSAITLLERGSGYLQPFAPVHMRVNVAQLLAEVACCLAEVKRLGPDGLGGFDWSLVPKIEIGE
jgi:predicted metal-dependent hydrolase